MPLEVSERQKLMWQRFNGNFTEAHLPHISYELCKCMCVGSKWGTKNAHIANEQTINHRTGIIIYSTDSKEKLLSGINALHSSANAPTFKP